MKEFFMMIEKIVEYIPTLSLFISGLALLNSIRVAHHSSLPSFLISKQKLNYKSDEKMIEIDVIAKNFGQGIASQAFLIVYDKKNRAFHLSLPKSNVQPGEVVAWKVSIESRFIRNGCDEFNLFVVYQDGYNRKLLYKSDMSNKVGRADYHLMNFAKYSKKAFGIHQFIRLKIWYMMWAAKVDGTSEIAKIRHNDSEEMKEIQKRFDSGFLSVPEEDNS